jgi:hypothetical protein
MSICTLSLYSLSLSLSLLYDALDFEKLSEVVELPQIDPNQHQCFGEGRQQHAAGHALCRTSMLVRSPSQEQLCLFQMQDLVR